MTYVQDRIKHIHADSRVVGVIYNFQFVICCLADIKTKNATLLAKSVLVVVLVKSVTYVCSSL